MTQARDKANIPVLNFASKGIDDNADATAITINSSEQLLVGTTDAPSSANTKLKVHVPLNSSGADAIEISHVTTGSDKPGASLGLVIGNNGSSTNAADLTFKTASGGSLSEAIRINSSGELLQGTTSPGYPEYGDNITLAGSGHSGLTIRSGTSSQGTMYFSDDTGTSAGTYSGAVIYKHNTNSMHFRTNSIDRVSIDSSGKVGIGTSSPSEELEVSGGQNTIIKSKTTTSTALSGFEAWNNSSAYMKMYSYSSSASGSDFGGVANANIALFEGQGVSNVVFSTWSNAGGSNPDFIFAPQRSQKVIIKSDGKVGIGISSPETLLHLSSTSPVITFQETDQSNRKFQIGSFGNAYGLYDATNSQYRYIVDTNGNHIFNEGGLDCDFRVESNNNANMLFIDGNNDRVGIGTASPSQKLDVSGTVKATAFQGDGSALTGVGGGKIIQVVNVTKTSRFTTTNALGTSFADVTGMSVAITPSASSSKILVLLNCILGQTNNGYGVGCRLLRDSTAVYIGDSFGNNSRMIAGQPTLSSQAYQVGIQYLDSPNTTSATTYKLQLATEAGGTAVIGSSGANNNVYFASGASSITLMEIGA